MYDFDLLSRRDFLKGAGAFGTASLIAWSGGCEACQKQIDNRPTRKNIQELSPSDPIITTFKNAVQQMKALPSSNPISWQAQATIHYNYCTHSNWLWLPWHRAYLVYFERICRKVTGDNSFALPYWNWVTHPAIPDVFWDTSSPLYDNRAVTQSDQASSSYVGASVIQNILNQTNFNVFASGPPPTSNLHSPGGPSTGMLEATPHNNIHSWAGGGCCDMNTFYSPLDPVFWTHHNMLDCLWTHWNFDLNNPNTNDPTWLDFNFTNFVDENGNPVTISVVTTLLFPIFTYQFEPCSFTQGAGAPSKIQRNKAALEKFMREGAPSKLEYKNRFELNQSLTADAARPVTGAIKLEPGAFREALEGGPKTRVVLTVADVDIPLKRDFFVRVFINQPDASSATPIEDPHFAGSFGFFFDDTILKAHPGEHAEAGSSERPKTGYLVDLTDAIRRLNQAGSLASDSVSVSFVPVPYDHRESSGQLTLQRLEVGVATF